jgi:hypothetical protein
VPSERRREEKPDSFLSEDLGRVGELAKSDDSRMRTPSLRLDQGTEGSNGPAVNAAASETIQ